MDNPLATQEDQAAENLFRETTDKVQGKALEVMRFDEFVQVHPKQLRRDAEMTPEIEALREVYHTVKMMGVLREFSLHPE